MSRVVVMLVACAVLVSRIGLAQEPGRDLPGSPLPVIAGSTLDTSQAKPAPPARPGSPAPPTLPTPPAQPAPPPAPAPVLQPPQTPPPSPPATLLPPAVPKKLVNVQLEFTITDQTGTRTPDKKTVSMIAADSTWGRVRASAVVSRPGAPPLPISLNVDARPVVLPGDSVQTELTVEYRPFVAAPQAAPEPETSQLNQSMTVILANGRSLVLSQAADPVADRKIVLEAKATVLK